MLINLLSYLNNCYSKNNGNESYSVVIKALQRVGGVPKTQNLLMALVSATDIKPDHTDSEKERGILDYRIYSLCVKSLRKLQAPLGTDEFVGVSFAQELKTLKNTLCS